MGACREGGARTGDDEGWELRAVPTTSAEDSEDKDGGGKRGAVHPKDAASDLESAPQHQYGGAVTSILRRRNIGLNLRALEGTQGSGPGPQYQYCDNIAAPQYQYCGAAISRELKAPRHGGAKALGGKPPPASRRRRLSAADFPP